MILFLSWGENSIFKAKGTTLTKFLFSNISNWLSLSCAGQTPSPWEVEIRRSQHVRQEIWDPSARSNTEFEDEKIMKNHEGCSYPRTNLMISPGWRSSPTSSQTDTIMDPVLSATRHARTTWESLVFVGFPIRNLRFLAWILCSDQPGNESKARGSLPTSKTMNKQFKFFMPGRISLMSVKCRVSSAITFWFFEWISLERMIEQFINSNLWRHHNEVVILVRTLK